MICGFVRLPGQDSNLDKENQNLLASQRKSKRSKALADQQAEPLAHTLAREVQKDPDLARVLTAWPTLPEATRAGIVAMMRAAGG
jgi:hypothetical protein